MSNRIAKYILYVLSVLMLVSCEKNRENWAPKFSGYGLPFSMDAIEHALDQEGWRAFLVTPVSDEDSTVLAKTDEYGETYYGAIRKERFTQAPSLLWVVYTQDEFDIAPFNEDSLWARNENGNSTILACDNFGYLLPSKPAPFITDSLASEVQENKACKISVIKDNVADTTYNFPTQMCKSRISHNPNSSFLNRYAEHRVLATIDSEPIAIQYKHENGSSLIFVSTPLLFTNYGLFYEEDAKFIFELFEMAKGADWRLMYQSTVKDSDYFITNPPRLRGDKSASPNDYRNGLRYWRDKLIVYSIIALFIGFLLFLARRRERIIPVINKPENRTIFFAQQMGRNYMWKEEYNVVTKKKFIAFISYLQDTLNINLNDTKNFDGNIATLEKLTGETNLGEVISNLFSLLKNPDKELSFEEMKFYIDTLNTITNKLK